MVLQSLDVGMPTAPLATTTSVVGLEGVRSVTAGTVDNCVLPVPGLLKCPATTCSGFHANNLWVPAMIPPTLPSLVWVPPPVKRHPSRKLGSSFRREYGCSSSSLTLDGQPLFTNLRTRECTWSLSVHCAISFVRNCVEMFAHEVKVSRYWYPYFVGEWQWAVWVGILDVFFPWAVFDGVFISTQC